MSYLGHVLDSALERAPKQFWTIAMSLERRRASYAPAVRRQFRQLQIESERWSAEEVARFQWAQLSRVLGYAYDAVPFYRTAFHDLGITPDEIRSPEDLASFPLLSKQDLQEHGPRLLAEGIAPDERRYFTSSGSTGVPVGFYDDAWRSPAIERTFIAALRKRVGYRETDRIARLRGTVIAADGLWQALPRKNALILSSYRLTEADIPALLAKLRSFKPRFIEGYPSSIGLLADYILDYDAAGPKGLTAVLCASEHLHEWQRTRIESAFGCRVFSHYGQSERVCLAGECEHSTALHVVPHYGFTELVDASGHVISEPGVPGEIVGTGFWTNAMPLIRYRTGDVAAFAEGFCPHCRRPHLRFERIEGRLQEFIISGTGRPISMTASVAALHAPIFENVRQFRFFQDTPGKVGLLIVPKREYSADTDDVRIRRELSKRLGPDMELTEIKIVDQIQPGPSGKHSFLEQRLDNLFESADKLRRRDTVAPSLPPHRT
jgi:phenylacetate-CoA ligase